MGIVLQNIFADKAKYYIFYFLKNLKLHIYQQAKMFQK